MFKGAWQVEKSQYGETYRRTGSVPHSSIHRVHVRETTGRISTHLFFSLFRFCWQNKASNCVLRGENRLVILSWSQTNVENNNAHNKCMRQQNKTFNRPIKTSTWTFEQTKTCKSRKRLKRLKRDTYYLPQRVKFVSSTCEKRRYFRRDWRYNGEWLAQAILSLQVCTVHFTFKHL